MQGGRSVGAAVATGFVTLLSLFCSTGSAAAQARPRLSRAIDEAVFTRLAGTLHPEAVPANDAGRAAPGLAMRRMQLILKASAEQEAALEALLAGQQDEASPSYHRWLTPDEFGARFGVAQPDIDIVVAWLTRRGFTVNEVARGRRSVDFSGSAAQVERAFHTEMRRYSVNGVRHLANSTEIAIPLALTPVVGGVASLHDFEARPLHRVVAANPALDLANGGHELAPADFALIYNVAPLWSQGIDGTGQTIAVVGRTNFNMSDVTGFRSTFGLPANNPTIVLNGADPGIVSQNEETEALLDVEWAGAVAKGATIKFVLSGSSGTTGGDVLSSQYIVNNNVAPVLSTSFGLCEASLGSGNTLFNALWKQAAAQGISVVVASGDSGAAGCDSPTATVAAASGFAVNGIASTPYNLAVGGTQFNEGSQSSVYWLPTNNAANGYLTATAYIPEAVWNQSSYTATPGAGNNLYAGAGGVSLLYATPAWQTGVGVPLLDPGTTTGHHRYLPDVSLSGATHDAYAVMLNGLLIGVGGTSAGAPSFAGILALLNQKTKSLAGNAAPALYSMAAKVPLAFHDVILGNNAVPCQVNTFNCNPVPPSTTIGILAGYGAGVGYDLATGLGSVNVYNLVTSWPVTAPAITSLSPNPIVGSTTAQTVTIAGTGFVTGLKVTVGGAALPASQVTFVSATQLQISIVAGLAAATLPIQVTNPSGVSSNVATLTVSAPPTPAISGLTPSPMTHSAANQVLTINGTNFQSGSGLKVAMSYTGFTTVIPATSIVFVSSTQLKATVNVGVTPRTWSVQVVNPSGKASATVPLVVK